MVLGDKIDWAHNTQLIIAQNCDVIHFQTCNTNSGVIKVFTITLKPNCFSTVTKSTTEKKIQKRIHRAHKIYPTTLI